MVPQGLPRKHSINDWVKKTLGIFAFYRRNCSNTDGLEKYE